MSYAKRIEDIGVRAKHLELCGAAKEVTPSKLPPAKPQSPRWTAPRKNPNGGWDVRRGNETRHFERYDEAEGFWERESRIGK